MTGRPTKKRLRRSNAARKTAKRFTSTAPRSKSFAMFAATMPSTALCVAGSEKRNVHSAKSLCAAVAQKAHDVKSAKSASRKSAKDAKPSTAHSKHLGKEAAQGRAKARPIFHTHKPHEIARKTASHKTRQNLAFSHKMSYNQNITMTGLA